MKLRPVIWSSPIWVAYLVLCACTGSGNEPKEGDQVDTTAARQQQDRGVVKVAGKIFCVPSPAQSVIFVRDAGIPYTKDLPLALTRADSFASKTSKGLALGVYGADLAYATVFQDGQRALGTMRVIEKLGNGLDMGNAFDRSFIDRFKNNLGSEDSLLRLSGEAFRSSDRYLKTGERDDVASLILAGGWIESMFLTVSGPGVEGNKAIATRLGEQKRTLSDMISLLVQSDKDKSCTELVAALRDLEASFAGVQIAYQFAPPMTDATKKLTIINSTSSVTLPATFMKEITGKVIALRAQITA